MIITKHERPAEDNRNAQTVERVTAQQFRIDQFGMAIDRGSEANVLKANDVAKDVCLFAHRVEHGIGEDGA